MEKTARLQIEEVVYGFSSDLSNQLASKGPMEVLDECRWIVGMKHFHALILCKPLGWKRQNQLSNVGWPIKVGGGLLPYEDWRLQRYPFWWTP